MSSVTPRSLVVLCGALAVVVGGAIQLLSRTPTVALVFAVMAGYLPVALLRSRARRRLREFAEVWPEAVDNLASAVRAGLSLPDALAGLSVRGPEPLRPAFERFAVDYQVTGRFGDSLDRLKAQLADPVGDRVAEAEFGTDELVAGAVARGQRALGLAGRYFAAGRSAVRLVWQCHQ